MKLVEVALGGKFGIGESSYRRQEGRFDPFPELQCFRMRESRLAVRGAHHPRVILHFHLNPEILSLTL